VLPLRQPIPQIPRFRQLAACDPKAIAVRMAHPPPHRWKISESDGICPAHDDAIIFRDLLVN
jgi:hypothetical protein